MRQWSTLAVALPFCHLEFRAARRKPARYPEQIDNVDDHIRAHRLDLNLLQKQVAEQIGVHEQTIIGWERNANIPELRYIPAIIHPGVQPPKLRQAPSMNASLPVENRSAIAAEDGGEARG